MMAPRQINGAIERGAIFIEEGTHPPDALRLEQGAQRAGWARAANGMTGGELEKTLTAAGWTSFYLAGAIEAKAFGFNRNRMIEAAWKRLSRGLVLDHCNCVSIDNVTERSWLGLPFVTISAHARQLHSENMIGTKR